MKVLLIVPAYNEALNIEKTIKDIKDNTDYDYVIINDCSKDNTKEICQKNEFNLINLPINYGLTSAIQVGMKYAKQKIKCYYFHIPQQILIPDICIEDIKKNAESIIASLEQLGREKDLWRFPMGDAAYRINAENASAVMYRHKANRILFQN